jgi:hypothetical protein
LHYGFDIGFPNITETYTLLNHSTLFTFTNIFQELVNHELLLTCYLGPFTLQQIINNLGPFQTSPISIIPKLHKPGSFQLIQNFLHPHSSCGNIVLINAGIASDDFSYIWTMFDMFALMVAQLPPGIEVAVCDIAEAYRTVPLHPLQWPGAVVQLPGDNQFAIDMQGSFWMASMPGVYGQLQDAAVDIMCSKGLGPIAK